MLSFNGSSLTQNGYPIGGEGAGVGSLATYGSLLYAGTNCPHHDCPTINGYSFQSGQLTSLGSWMDERSAVITNIAIY